MTTAAFPALPLTGHCQCGDVAYTVNAPAYVCYTCHCIACQQLSASAFTSCMQLPVESVVVTQGEPSTRVRQADSGNLLTSWFCQRCGSALFAQSSARPRIKTVFIGTLAQFDAIPVNAHIWLKRKLPWVELPSGHRMFEGAGDWTDDYASDPTRYKP